MEFDIEVYVLGFVKKSLRTREVYKPLEECKKRGKISYIEFRRKHC